MRGDETDKVHVVLRLFYDSASKNWLLTGYELVIEQTRECLMVVLKYFFAEFNRILNNPKQFILHQLF
jgi:hypothetical protein